MKKAIITFAVLLSFIAGYLLSYAQSQNKIVAAFVEGQYSGEIGWQEHLAKKVNEGKPLEDTALAMMCHSSRVSSEYLNEEPGRSTPTAAQNRDSINTIISFLSEKNLENCLAK